MQVSIAAAMERAAARMRRMLFAPFTIEAWLKLGFVAFLARLSSGGGASVPIRNDIGWHPQGDDLERLPGQLRDQLLDLVSRPAMLLLIGAGLIVLGVVIVVLLWLSSRGQIMFMDAVARERAAIGESWRSSRELGRSLFLWQAAFSFAWLVPLAFVAAIVVAPLRALFAGDGLVWPPLVFVLFAGGLAALSALAIGLVGFLLHEFVVPLMVAHGEHATVAWRRFLALAGPHLGALVGYTILVIVIEVVAAAVVLALGLMTCCVGFLLLSIPFVGTVLLLPLLVWRRAMGPELLGAFAPPSATAAP